MVNRYNHGMALNGIDMLDKVDSAIVEALQRDGTLSQNGLSELVGASPASCWRRVKALEASGVLGPIVRLANAKALGLTVTVLCHVRLKNHLPETSLAFENMLNCTPAIVQCFAMSGDWDYLLQVISSDIGSYEAWLRNEVLTNVAVAAASSTFALSIRKQTTELPVYGVAQSRKLR